MPYNRSLEIPNRAARSMTGSGAANSGSDGAPAASSTQTAKQDAV